MTQDQSSRGGNPAPGARPRPGESTRPNHPVLKRDGDPSQLIVSPPPSGPGHPVSKTFVVDQEGGDSATQRNPFQDDIVTSPGIRKPVPGGDGSPPLANLFDDEDMPTLNFDKQAEPFDEESLVLTPESLDSATNSAPPGQGSSTGAVHHQTPPDAPWLQNQSGTALSQEPVKRRSGATWVIFMIIGGVLIVAVSAVLGALLVWRSTGSEPSHGNVAIVSNNAVRPVAEGSSGSSSERPASGGSTQTEPAGQATAVGVPVPIVPSDSAPAEEQAPSIEGAAVAEGVETPPEEATQGAHGADGAEGGDRTETTEETEATEGEGEAVDEQETETPSTSGDIASVLSPLTDQVRRCTRREQGYHPRALTLHLVPEAVGRRRLRAITPPTPPRVVGCIARLLDGVTLPSPTSGSGSTLTYTFELR